MARRRTSNHLSTIEYIGPRPQKKQVKRPNFLGGWVVLLIAAGAAYHFGSPLMSLVKAQEVPATPQAATALVSTLETTGGFGNRLAAAALKLSNTPVTYDASYYKVSYPWGDIPSTKGKAEDLVIRSYRALGVDLQQKVHDDITSETAAYSSLLENAAPDPSNDHRRAIVLERFFERHGESLAKSRNHEDYLPGDVIVWRKPDASVANGDQIPRHIGIVVPGPGGNTKELWVVDHLDTTVKWENALFSYQLLGHYRYEGDQAKAAATAANTTEK